VRGQYLPGLGASWLALTRFGWVVRSVGRPVGLCRRREGRSCRRVRMERRMDRQTDSRATGYGTAERVGGWMIKNQRCDEEREGARQTGGEGRLQQASRGSTGQARRGESRTGLGGSGDPGSFVTQRPRPKTQSTSSPLATGYWLVATTADVPVLLRYPVGR
jgi:hypothetical protein